MLAYYYVIIDHVDPQLRQRLVFAVQGAVQGGIKIGPLFLITRVCLLTLNIMNYVSSKKYSFPFNVIVINCHDSAV